MERLSVQFLSPHLWRWVLLLIPALCVAFWAYYRILAPLGRPSRWALWILRGLAFSLVLFALWQPVATVVIPDTGRPSLAVLLDRSGSMDLPGGSTLAKNASRSDQLASIRQSLEEELDGEFRLQWYLFDESLEQMGADSLGPAGGNTSIGRALESVLVRASSRPVNGIVLVSDGVNTMGRDPVRIARTSPVPIFTVAVGPEEPLSDLEIRRVQSNDHAFTGEPLPMTVILSTTGLAGRKAKIEIREKPTGLHPGTGDNATTGLIRHTEEVEILGGQGLEQEIRFSLHPETPGLVLYDILATVDGDSVPGNNRRQIAVEVLERKTRVLVVADALTWDFGFLRRTLEADTTLGYSYLVRTESTGYRSYGTRRIDDLPQSVAALREFAGVILLATGEQDFPGTFLEPLGQFVREGGGLFILGGPRRARDWENVSGLTRILPARIIQDPTPRNSSLAVETTTQGLRHAITAIRENPSETSRLFSALPPLWRTGNALEAKGGAKVLLRYRGDDAKPPALVTDFADRGKVVWLHGHGLWRWRLTAAGTELPDRLYADFLHGVVRWIAEPAIRERFQVQPGKRVYQNGEPVTFAASLWDAGYAPVPGAAISLRIRSATDSLGSSTHAPIDLAPGSEPGQYDGRGPRLQPGEYEFTAQAINPTTGEEFASGEGRFWVEPMGAEYSRTWADRETLRQIAGQSGGQSVEMASISALVDQIPQAIHRLKRVREIELWNHWVLFAFFVLVLSTEWFLRRRRGLA